MSIRKNLSKSLREAKKLGGFVYDDLIEGTGCSKSSIRYALNGGDNASVEVFQKLFDYMEVEVSIHIEKMCTNNEQIDS